MVHGNSNSALAPGAVDAPERGEGHPDGRSVFRTDRGRLMNVGILCT